MPATKSSAFRSLVNERYSTYILTALNSTDYTMKLKPSDLIALKRDTVQRTIDTISNRINELGLAESTVQQYGRAGADYEILVQLPGVDDPARVKELIGTAAVLEIDDVKDGPFPSREAGLAQHGGVLPLNTKLAKCCRAPAPRASSGTWWARAPVITGREMRNARAGPGRVPQVGDQFHPLAGRRQALRPLSPRSQHRQPPGGGAGQPDRQRGHHPVARSRIPAASPVWASEEEAVDLSRYLRSGSLPAGIKYLEESSVGPSLGADSIHEGFVAGIAGLIAVVVVMLVYYKRSGVNAVLALLLNTVILLAAISLLPCRADAAGNRRRHPDHRYGGGFQRADFRAYPRGVAGRERRWSRPWMRVSIRPGGPSSTRTSPRSCPAPFFSCLAKGR